MIFNSGVHLEAHLKAANKKEFGRPLHSFDLETEGFWGKIVLASTANPNTAFASADIGLVLATLNSPVVGHNFKYDIRCLAEQGYGLPPQGLILDTQAAASLVDENMKIGLKPLGFHYFNAQELGINEQMWQRWLKGYKEQKTDDLESYATVDAIVTRRLMIKLWPILEQEGMLSEFLKIECPQTLLAAEMETRGIALDRVELEKRSIEAEQVLAGFRETMKEIVPDAQWFCLREGCEGGTYHPKRGADRPCTHCEGTGLNQKIYRSPEQLGNILFNELGLEPEIETDAGNPSTNHESLVLLKKQAEEIGHKSASEFIDILFQYREWDQLNKMFYAPYMALGASRVHCNFKPWGGTEKDTEGGFPIRTGRWSTDSPNMQQVPSEVRTVFVPDPGFDFASVDYVQLELYIMAYLAQEDKILRAYEAGDNLHQATADLVGVPYDIGKTINFSLAYGASPSTLAARLGISKGQAQQYSEKILGGYSRLGEFFDRTIKQARENGYVKTFSARKRRLPEITASNFAVRGHAERQAVNAVIQGTAAYLIKAALIASKLKVPEAQPLLQVHDEILFQVPKEHSKEIGMELKDVFENVSKTLRLRADVNIMERWK